MTSRPSLRRRAVAIVIGYVVLLSLAVVIHGYVINERVEQLTWESIFESKLVNFIERRQNDRNFGWTDTESLTLFGHGSGRRIPEAFSHLPAGVHNEVPSDNRQYVIFVHGEDPQRTVMALDITDMEQREKNLTLIMVGSAIMSIVVLTMVTIVGARHLMRPLTSFKQSIANLHPDDRNVRILIDDSDPHEIATIADAVNDYLQRIDAYVERERAFIHMASHELRTPIAVAAGAAEVVLDSEEASPSLRAHIQRIRRTMHSMEQLVTLLLALARDPARLRASMDSVDLALMLPEIVQDHLHLAKGMELSFEYGAMPATNIEAPQQILRAAIGNLIRNAIENSSRGVIRISITGSATVMIEDPGSAMAAVELSRLYARKAQAGEVMADGIGLDLIARLCQHLGWALDLIPQPAGGTVARLSLAPPAGIAT